MVSGKWLVKQKSNNSSLTRRKTAPSPGERERVDNVDKSTLLTSTFGAPSSAGGFSSHKCDSSLADLSRFAASPPKTFGCLMFWAERVWIGEASGKRTPVSLTQHKGGLTELFKSHAGGASSGNILPQPFAILAYFAGSPARAGEGKYINIYRIPVRYSCNLDGGEGFGCQSVEGKIA